MGDAFMDKEGIELLGPLLLWAELAKDLGDGEEGGFGFHAGRGPIAAPGPFLRGPCHAGTYRIEHDIPGKLKKIAVLVDDDGLVPSLKHMAGLPVLPVNL